MGQILSDEGDVEEAINSLIDALKWDPRNSFALIMMGNILARSKDDVPIAMKYYNKSLEINPNDNIAINNIGANLMQLGKIEQAKEYFEKALAINPDYPNTHYALAIVTEIENELPSAFYSATIALKKSKSKDGLYKQALNLAVQTAKNLIQSDIGQKVFKEYLHKLEFEGNIQIKAVVDDSIATAAKIELAENYDRDHHVIRYKSEYPAKEHLMMHELVHIQLIIQARKERVNKLFISTQGHKRHYITSESEWIKKMNRMGLSEDSISKVISDLFEGINRQILNTPIDLFIEDFLYNEFPDLRPYQFLSEYALMKEGIQAVTDKKIIELSPKTTLYNSKIFNIISALHFKNLYGVDLIDEFHATPKEFKEAHTMYNEFLEYRDDRAVGEEYELVQNWADDLKLEKNFALVDELQYRQKNQSSENLMVSLEKDPLDLESDTSRKEHEMKQFQESQERIGTNMAVVMFMVDALEYFKDMPLQKIKGIAHEIAMLGTQGFRPDQQGYRLALVPGKKFSGYHILSWYYVSWKLAIPEMLPNLALPYDDEYNLALTLFEAKKNE